MATTLHWAEKSEFFRGAQEEFEAMVAWLTSNEAPISLDELERGIHTRGQKTMLKLWQAHLDCLSARERAQAPSPPAGVEVRAHTRQVEGRFGRGQLRRLGYKAPGERVRFPLDALLNLPADLYSHSVRECMAWEAQRGSWDQAIENVERTTAAHVPKRQAEQIVTRAAQDFDAFYDERPQTANDAQSTTSLLALSSDSTSVRVRFESLRDATRKQAEAAAQQSVRGDPIKAKPLRNHDKRMAVATAVWEQEPQVRTAEQIVENFKRGQARSRSKHKWSSLPKPQNKRVSATIEKDQTMAIEKMFQEAARRDPTRTRTAIALVDGERRQIEAIEQQARHFGFAVTIVLDIIHVLHYLWGAGMAMCCNKEREAEKWVATYLLKVLTRPALDVVAGIRQAATKRGLTRKQGKPVEKCARYLLNNAPYIRYNEFLARGFPIATGVIEGCCRYLVHDRLDITGAQWNLESAEAVLRLRALRASGDWTEYWSYHLRCESMRNYQAAA
jgi:hypothetical protein